MKFKCFLKLIIIFLFFTVSVYPRFEIGVNNLSNRSLTIQIYPVSMVFRGDPVFTYTSEYNLIALHRNIEGPPQNYRYDYINGAQISTISPYTPNIYHQVITGGVQINHDRDNGSISGTDACVGYGMIYPRFCRHENKEYIRKERN